MGAAEGKPVLPASESLFSEPERALLQEFFRNTATHPANSKQRQEDVISFATFQKLLEKLVPEELHEEIYLNFAGTSGLQSPSNANVSQVTGIKYAQFVDGVARVLKGNRLHFYMSLFTRKGPDISCHTVAKILQWDSNMWYNLAKIDADEDMEYEKDTFLKLGMQICFVTEGNQDQTSLAALEKWASEQMKNLGDGLAYALQTAFKLQIFDFMFPRSLFESHILVSRAEAWLVYQVAPHSNKKERDGTFSSSSWRQWQLLYSSQRDGWSVSRFCTKALDYKSHTLLLLRDSKRRLFGGFVAEEWKLSPPSVNSRYFHENPECKECFLFSLHPTFQKFTATGISHHHFMLMCDSLTKSGGDTELIAMGGQIDFYRLCLYEGLAHGKCRSVDTSFKQGNLLRTNYQEEAKDVEEEFQIVGIELWGGGGDEVSRRQQELKIRDQDLAIRMRKVNRNLMFGVEDPKSVLSTDAAKQSMNLLEMAGVHTSHVHQGDHVM